MSARKTILTILAVAVFATSAIAGGLLAGSDTGSALADAPRQESPLQRFIVVTGYGTASGSPDIAFVNVGVESLAPDIAAALDENNRKMEAIMAVLAENGVAPEDVRTDYFNIYQDPGYPMPFDSASSDPNQPQPTYRVNNSVTVTVRDVSTVGNLLSAVISAGANMINGVTFSISDRAALESDARVDALTDARDRAQQLADQLGVQLGDVLELTETSAGIIGPYDLASGMGGGGGGVPPVSQGSLTVSLTLTIKFAIQ